MRSPSPVPELEALRRIPGLETGPTAELIALDSVSGRCHLKAGDVVLEPGRAPEHVLLVVSGTVEVRVAGGAPTRVGAGEMVGLRALRAGAQHEEAAVVVVDAEVLSVRIDVVDRLLSLPSVDRLLRKTRPAGATMARRPMGVTVRVDGTGVAG